MARIIKPSRQYRVTGQLPKNNLIGTLFEKLTVVEFAGFAIGSNHAYWKCECQCGNAKECRGDHLVNGKIKSCGCVRRARSNRFIDLAGRTFGRWMVLEYSGRVNRGSNSQWKCECKCGTIRIVRGRELITGGSTSCGCYQRENAKQMNTTHGMSSLPEYDVWARMIGRCHRKSDPSYSRYGGRGIVVCNRWRTSFKAFMQDMGCRPSSAHSIDRINNNCGYSPKNCRWATSTEQCNNRRSSRLLSVNGETLTMAEWAVRSGIKRTTIWARLNRGWAEAESVWSPVK